MNYKNYFKINLLVLIPLGYFIIAQQIDCNVGTLYNYSFSEEHSRTISLPNRLIEISGLAVTGDDRLFSHNDEIETA